MQLGNWDVEVDEQVSPSALVSGSAFLGSTSTATGHQLGVGSKRMMLAPGLGKSLTSLPSRRLAGTDCTPAMEADPSTQRCVSIPSGAWLLQEGSEGGRAIYVDAFLVKHLRPHQLDGVKFLFSVRNRLTLHPWQFSDNLGDTNAHDATTDGQWIACQRPSSRFVVLGRYPICNTLHL